MTQDKIEEFLVLKGGLFSFEKQEEIKEKLEKIDDSKFSLIMNLDYIDPTMLTIISVVFGELGIDRFLLGDIKMGIIKFLTLGGCLVIGIMDWFSMGNKAKQFNFDKINNYLEMQNKK